MQKRPNIEPDELYEMGGYLHYVHLKQFDLHFVEDPFDFLNEVWAGRTDRAAKIQSEAERRGDPVPDYPNPFQSITLGFDYWIRPDDDDDQMLSSNHTQDSKPNVYNLTMSICNQMHQEPMIIGQWMYAAVRLNLDLLDFQYKHDLHKCVRNVYAKIVCNRFRTGDSGLIGHLAVKNVEVLFEYVNEMDDDPSPTNNGNTTTFKSLKKRIKWSKQTRSFINPGPSLQCLPYSNRNAEKNKKLLVKVAKKVVKAKIAAKLNVNLGETKLYFPYRRSPDLLFTCDFGQCNSFRMNDRTVTDNDWQGLQWAPFLPNQLQEYLGTDQNNVSMIVRFEASEDAHQKCLAFRYYAATFSRIHVSLGQNSERVVATLEATIKADNRDRSNLALEWYDNELCLADLFTPDQWSEMVNPSPVNSTLINRYDLVFTSSQPESGGYVAIGSIKLVDDWQRPASSPIDRQVLTGWDVDGAGAAEQWTSLPADARWILPQLSVENRLTIMIRKPRLLGTSAYTLLSGWFARTQDQTLRYELFNNFSHAVQEVQLIASNYSVEWTSGYTRLWPGEIRHVHYAVDELIKVQVQDSRAHYRWRIVIMYTNDHEPVSKFESVWIRSLDQSDACARPDTCLHGSTCQSIGPNQRVCSCTTGHHGDRCEYRDQCVLPLPGQRSGIEQCAHQQAFGCIAIGSNFRCECAAAKTLTDHSNHNATTETTSFSISTMVTPNSVNATPTQPRMWSETHHECVVMNDCSRLACSDPLQRCVKRNGLAQCECITGYESFVTGVVDSDGLFNRTRCVPSFPCHQRECPSGAKCVDISGQILSTNDLTKLTFCYCDPLDGWRRVPTTENVFGFVCQPSLRNPFVKQAYKCYMDYEMNTATISNQTHFSMPNDFQNKLNRRKKRWIFDGQEERAFDFNREDSNGVYTSKDMHQTTDTVHTLDSKDSNDEIKLESILCKCATGYRLIDQICVPNDDIDTIDCQPSCGPTEHCVHRLIDPTLPITNETNRLNDCECAVGFSGPECSQSWCDFEAGREDERMCGSLGCRVGISALELNWFACNCDAATLDSNEMEPESKSVSAYQTDSVSGLCAQRNICDNGTAERAECDRAKGVCVARQSARDGALWPHCVCPLGFGWHSGSGQCVSLCDLDTHCGPLNARCQLIPNRNATECVCPVGRRWDPLRSACVFGDRRNRLYRIQVAFQLTNQRDKQMLYEQANGPISSIDCARNLDPVGCAQQLGSARRRLAGALYHSVGLKQLLEAELSEKWTSSLRSVYGSDVIQVSPIDVEWQTEYEPFSFEEEDDVLAKGDNSSLVSRSNRTVSVEPIPPVVSFYYRTIVAYLLIDTGGLIDWTDLTLLHRACVPLLNETLQQKSQSKSSATLCALAPAVLLQPDSLLVTEIKLCDIVEERQLCPAYTYHQCSPDGKRFGCPCRPGFKSFMRIPQDVDGSMLIHFCEDIDECKQIDSKVCASSAQTCVNLPGSYRCDCAPGHKPLNDSVCVGKCHH